MVTPDLCKLTCHCVTSPEKSATGVEMLRNEPARPPALKRPAADRQPAERSSSAATSLRSVPLCVHGPEKSPSWLTAALALTGGM